MVTAPYHGIFCKSTYASFTSIEHIVPESLGNTEHVLPRGVACDTCNNYFANKVEGPILSSDFFMQARHRNGIPNKPKRIPVQDMLSFPHEFTLLYTDKSELYFVIAIFGIQYTINLGGPEIDGYLEWRSASANTSPLYASGT